MGAGRRLAEVRLFETSAAMTRSLRVYKSTKEMQRKEALKEFRELKTTKARAEPQVEWGRPLLLRLPAPPPGVTTPEEALQRARLQAADPDLRYGAYARLCYIVRWL